jgi:hypothetical protein
MNSIGFTIAVRSPRTAATSALPGAPIVLDDVRLGRVRSTRRPA